MEPCTSSICGLDQPGYQHSFLEAKVSIITKQHQCIRKFGQVVSILSSDEKRRRSTYGGRGDQVVHVDCVQSDLILPILISNCQYDSHQIFI